MREEGKIARMCPKQRGRKHAVAPANCVRTSDRGTGGGRTQRVEFKQKQEGKGDLFNARQVSHSALFKTSTSTTGGLGKT